MKGKKAKQTPETIQFLSSLLIFHLVDFFMDLKTFFFFFL